MNMSNWSLTCTLQLVSERVPAAPCSVTLVHMMWVLIPMNVRLHLCILFPALALQSSDVCSLLNVSSDEAIRYTRAIICTALPSSAIGTYF